ncbi:MAG: hypothetical protein ACL93V_01935 [Candidatus Electrothrix sp. YB6]
MKKIILGAGAICAVSLLAGAVESNADITVYTDKAAWEAAVADLEGECTVTTEDFEGVLEHGWSVDSTYNNPNIDPVCTGTVLCNPARTARTVNGEWYDRLVNRSGDDGYYSDTLWRFAKGGEGAYAFGGDWDLTVEGYGSEIEVCDKNLQCKAVPTLPNTLNGFWGLVSTAPFTDVLLWTVGGQETYTLDNMVIAFDDDCHDCTPVDDFKALINIDRTEDDHDRARFQMLGAAEVPNGVCTEDFNLTLTDSAHNEVFNTDDLPAGADVHCKCNLQENCFVTVRATDIDQEVLDASISAFNPITATFTVGAQCYESTDDWRQQDSGSTTVTPDANKSQWSKFRTP